MTDIYGMTPVNKQAGIVTSQKGCRPETDEDRLEYVKKSYTGYQELLLQLKDKIGIDRAKTAGRGRRVRYPSFVLRHPDFGLYMQTKEKLGELNKQISDLKKKVKTNKENKFEKKFIHLIKEKYPEIYKEIRDIVLEKDDDDDH